MTSKQNSKAPNATNLINPQSITDFQNAVIIFEKRPKIPKSIVGSIYDLYLVINPFGVAVCVPVLKIV